MALLIFLISRTFQIIAATVYYVDVFTLSDSTRIAVIVCHEIVYSFLYTSFLYLVIWRFYLLFFRLNWKKSSLNSQWKQYLSENHEIYDNMDWFLRNKHTFGDKKKSGIVIFSIYFLHSSVICMIYILKSTAIASSESLSSISFLLEVLFWFPPFITCILLYFLSPSYYDYFFVRNEMRLFCIAYGCDIGVSLLLYSVSNAFDREV